MQQNDPEDLISTAKKRAIYRECYIGAAAAAATVCCLLWGYVPWIWAMAAAIVAIAAIFYAARQIW